MFVSVLAASRMRDDFGPVAVAGPRLALKQRRNVRRCPVDAFSDLTTQSTAHSAATAASATVLSCSPVPPLTPTAPTTWPLCRRGTPPVKIMMRPALEACIP